MKYIFIRKKKKSYLQVLSTDEHMKPYGTQTAE